MAAAALKCNGSWHQPLAVPAAIRLQAEDRAAMAGVREVEEFDRIDLGQQHREICAAGGDFGIVLRLGTLFFFERSRLKITPERNMIVWPKREHWVKSNMNM